MQASEVLIDTSGVMRCCLQSLGEFMGDDPEREVSVGDRVPCKYETESEGNPTGFELSSDGVWRPVWVGERERSV